MEGFFLGGFFQEGLFPYLVPTLVDTDSLEVENGGWCSWSKALVSTYQRVYWQQEATTLTYMGVYSATQYIRNNIQMQDTSNLAFHAVTVILHTWIT